MLGFRMTQWTAATIAAVGMCVPQSHVVAAGKIAAPLAKQAAAQKVADVALAGQDLAGRVVDGQGNAIDGANVVVSQGQTEVAKTVSNNDGAFVVRNVKPGVYTVSTGTTANVVRVWSERMAPPAAADQALLVADAGAARGQCCDPCGGCGGNAGMWLLTAGVIAAIALSTVAIAEANDSDTPASP